MDGSVSDLSLGSVPPLLLQSVNRSVFEQMMVEHFAESVHRYYRPVTGYGSIVSMSQPSTNILKNGSLQ